MRNYILFILLALTLISCGSSDDGSSIVNPPVPDKPIVVVPRVIKYVVETDIVCPISGPQGSQHYSVAIPLTTEATVTATPDVVEVKMGDTITQTVLDGGNLYTAYDASKSHATWTASRNLNTIVGGQVFLSVVPKGSSISTEQVTLYVYYNDTLKCYKRGMFGAPAAIQIDTTFKVN